MKFRWRNPHISTFTQHGSRGPRSELTTQNILSGALSKTRFPIPLDPLEVISRYLHRLTVSSYVVDPYVWPPWLVYKWATWSLRWGDMGDCRSAGAGVWGLWGGFGCRGVVAMATRHPDAGSRRPQCRPPRPLPAAQVTRAAKKHNHPVLYGVHHLCEYCHTVFFIFITNSLIFDTHINLGAIIALQNLHAARYNSMKLQNSIDSIKIIISMSISSS